MAQTSNSPTMIARLDTSNIRDLPDLNRTGHTCANLEGELLFLWGASSEQSPSGSSRDSHLWILDTLTGYWRHRNCSGECPPYLSGASSALIGQRMYLFGGHSSAQDNWLNSLYCLDLNTFVWRDLGSQALAEPTKPVRSDKCTGWSYSGSFYVFGGYGWAQLEHLLQLLDRQPDFQLAPDYRWPKFGWNNQLVAFDPRTNTWSWPSYSGRCPSARAAHSGALLADKYYVFGGRDSHQRLNDLYVLDMNTLHWTQLAAHIDLTDPIEQPILHLDEIQEQADEVNQRQPAREQSPGHLVEHTPSPSSSAQYQARQEFDDSQEEEEELSSASSSSSSSRSGVIFYQPMPNNTGSTDDTDYEDDEDLRDLSQRPRYPAHMLERWSNQSPSSSSQVDGANCSIMQQPGQSLSRPEQGYLGESSSPTEAHHSSQVDRDEHLNNEGAHMERRASYRSLEDTQSASEPLRPVGRSFATFTPVSHKDVLLYGGISSQDKSLDECWLFDTERLLWFPVETRIKQPRLWHTAARSRNNEVLVIGGSCSTKVDEFCSDVLTMSLEPKSLKRLALDSAAKSIQMRSIQRVRRLPGNIYKLIKLRKQAIALTMRRGHSSRGSLAQTASSARLAN